MFYLKIGANPTPKSTSESRKPLVYAIMPAMENLSARGQLEQIAEDQHFYEEVVRWVASRVKNREIAEEIVQEAFLKVSRRVAKSNGGKINRSYVKTAINFLIIDHWRKQGKGREVMQIVKNRPSVQQIPQPDARLDAVEVAKVADKVTRRINGTKRQVFLLHLGEWSRAEISAELDMVPATVGTNLRRARLAIQEQLAS